MTSDALAPYDAVLLLSFGGPEAPDEVMPFLRRVTAGRGIPDERLQDVAHHYELFGGRSPINDQNRALIAALEAELKEREIDVPVLWGNRNSPPFLADTLRDAAARGLHRIVVVTTSAYSSLLLLPAVPREPRRRLRRGRRRAGPRDRQDRPVCVAARLRRSQRPPRGRGAPIAGRRRRRRARPPLRHPLDPRRDGRDVRPRRRRGPPLPGAAPRSGRSGRRPRCGTRSAATSRPRSSTAPGPDRRASRGSNPTSTTASRSWRPPAAGWSSSPRSASSPTTWRSSTTSTPRPPRPPNASDLRLVRVPTVGIDEAFVAGLVDLLEERGRGGPGRRRSRRDRTSVPRCAPRAAARTCDRPARPSVGATDDDRTCPAGDRSRRLSRTSPPGSRSRPAG